MNFICHSKITLDRQMDADRQTDGRTDMTFYRDVVASKNLAESRGLNFFAAFQMK